jgi:hypothetical protein
MYRDSISLDLDLNGTVSLHAAMAPIASSALGAERPLAGAFAHFPSTNGKLSPTAAVLRQRLPGLYREPHDVFIGKPSLHRGL